MKKAIYLPSGYKNRRYTKVAGRARSGEVSPKGLVAHTEDWEGRLAAQALPSAIRYVRTPDGWRPMTMKEMIDRGYFVVAAGPTGIRRVKEGIHERQDRPQKG